MTFWAYVLRCSDGSYYTGHTDDLEQRFGQHQSGLIPGYTQKRRPVTLMWSQEFATRDEALSAELRIKDWSRAKKEAFFKSDWAAVGEFAKPPARRSRLDVSTGSTSARTERISDPPALGELANPPARRSRLDASTGSTSARTERISDPHAVRVEPASSEAETRRRDSIKPIIVLVRPQLGQNIGKAARAMLNFGLSEMRLVAPRDGWPNPDAGPAASGADRVLEEARVYDSVAEAVADCGLVFASTVRRRDLVMPVVGPEEMAREIHSTAGRTAILFGPERSGLESEDVALASHIVTVPINPDFGSLNLAQAVILLAYEWSRGGTLAQPTAKEEEPPAPMADLDGLIRQLDVELQRVGYFHPPERTSATRTTIRTILSKARWSTREIKALRGIIRALTSPRSQAR